MFYLPRHYADEMIAHAKAEAPNECCGILAGSDDGVAKVYCATNIEKSPVRYNIDPGELFRIYREVEERGWDFLGIYHSHTHSEAYPSGTDVELAFWPTCLYFIVSLRDPSHPVIKAFNINDGEVREEQVKIVD